MKQIIIRSVRVVLTILMGISLWMTLVMFLSLLVMLET